MKLSQKEFFKNILLLSISITFAFLVLEAVSRFFYPVRFQYFFHHSTQNWPGTPFIESYFRPSGTLGYELVPNSKLGTNSLGMLDKERRKNKPGGIYRIMCLGDSTTANSQYVSILEELLNENKKEPGFEVWNCGVMGYGILQYCTALKEKWLRYNPDMVIIGFCLNDFDTTPLVVKEHRRLVGYFPHREISPQINTFLLRHSAFYRFMVMKIFFSEKDATMIENRIKQASYSLKEVKDLLSAKKISFLIVILGLPERLDKYPSRHKRTYAEIKSIIKECKISSLDTVTIFENNNPESLRFLPGDELHFNRKGSRIVCEAIYAYLKQNFNAEKAEKIRQ